MEDVASKEQPVGNLGGRIANQTKPKITLSADVTLPSNGVMYGEADSASVTVSALTMQEEKILADPSRQRSDVMNTVISQCVTGLTIPYDELLIGDRMFLLFMVRNVSYGAGYDMNLKCPGCSNNFAHHIEIPGDISIRMLEDGDEEPFFVTSSVTEDVIGLRLLRVKDEKEIQRYSRQKASTNSSGDVAHTYRLAKHIVSVNGVEMSSVKAKEYVEGLYSRESYEIVDAIDDMTPGPRISMDIVCPHCGNEYKETMPFTDEFFRPKRTRIRG